MRARPVRKGTDVDYDLKRPCDDCPFRKSSRFHEGVAIETPQLVQSMTDRVFAHTCHKTDPRADSPQGQRYEGRLQHCVGALFMLIKTGRGFDIQVPYLEAAHEGRLDLDSLVAAAKADTECFTVLEFLQFQGRGLGRLIDERDRRERNRRRGRKAVR
jgi:hypothetical protein